jgi:hypothetical protein
MKSTLKFDMDLFVGLYLLHNVVYVLFVVVLLESDHDNDSIVSNNSIQTPIKSSRSKRIHNKINAVTTPKHFDSLDLLIKSKRKRKCPQQNINKQQQQHQQHQPIDSEIQHQQKQNKNDDIDFNYINSIDHVNEQCTTDRDLSNVIDTNNDQQNMTTMKIIPLPIHRLSDVKEETTMDLNEHMVAIEREHDHDHENINEIETQLQIEHQIEKEIQIQQQQQQQQQQQ